MKLSDFAHQQTHTLKAQHRFRTIERYDALDGPYVMHDGKKLLSFCSNDYFGLSKHPDVIDAAQHTPYHTGNGASQLVSGSSSYYATLESQLARMKHTQAACITGSGYLANIGVIPALVGKGDLVIADKLAHACIIDGIKLSTAKFIRFKHNNINDLEKILKSEYKNYNNILIITETVFSMDGDIAPMDDIIQLARKYNAWTMSDDAHGLGLVNFQNKPDIQMGTLSKAAGSYGGYISASDTVISYLKTAMRPILFSTALPDNIIVSAIAALKLIEDNPAFAHRLRELSDYACKALSIPPTGTPIIPYIVGDEQKALSLQQRLYEQGFLVKAIRPPTVPIGTSRLRITLSLLHDKPMIDALCKAILHG